MAGCATVAQLMQREYAIPVLTGSLLLRKFTHKSCDIRDSEIEHIYES